MWQFTDRGTVAGLHPSDMNVATVAWFDAVRAGRPGAHHMDRQEDDMPRPNYQFAEGVPNPNARYQIIDWRDGAYTLPDGTVGYGPHWYHTGDSDLPAGSGAQLAQQREVYQLVGNGYVDPARPIYLAAGNDGLDAAYAEQPHVHAGAAPVTPGTAPAPGLVDVDELVPRLAGPVATEIAQRAHG